MELFHFIGICPDAMSHFDLLDLLMLGFLPIFTSYFNKIIALFKRKGK